METQMLNTHEAAAYVGVAIAQFRRYLAAGLIAPDMKVNPRCFLYSRAALDAFKATPRRPRGWAKGRPRKTAA